MRVLKLVIYFRYPFLKHVKEFVKFAFKSLRAFDSVLLLPVLKYFIPSLLFIPCQLIPIPSAAPSIPLHRVRKGQLSPFRCLREFLLHPIGTSTLLNRHVFCKGPSLLCQLFVKRLLNFIVMNAIGGNKLINSLSM